MWLNSILKNMVRVNVLSVKSTPLNLNQRRRSFFFNLGQNKSLVADDNSIYLRFFFALHEIMKNEKKKSAQT